MQFIDMDTVGNDKEGNGIDTRLIDYNPEQTDVTDARITLDKFFRVLIPETATVHLHIDLELQGDYYPGYSLVKRGIYKYTKYWCQGSTFSKRAAKLGLNVFDYDKNWCRNGK